jgi:hypothetical protein
VPLLTARRCCTAVIFFSRSSHKSEGCAGCWRTQGGYVSSFALQSQHRAERYAYPGRRSCRYPVQPRHAQPHQASRSPTFPWRGVVRPLESTAGNRRKFASSCDATPRRNRRLDVAPPHFPETAAFVEATDPAWSQGFAAASPTGAKSPASPARAFCPAATRGVRRVAAGPLSSIRQI